ncbi:hypothetical protein ACFSKL_02810 [Belliella marina]|uniref:Lipoprotein n=1 Tax=Belliella marina TaxID=1644146 RepID=A0ABW4VJJ0_9BACT
MKSNLFYILFCILFIGCSKELNRSFKLDSVKTTLIELGSMEKTYNIKNIEEVYSSSRIDLSPSCDNYILLKGKNGIDSISLVSTKNVLGEIVEGLEFQYFPTDNLSDCYDSNGFNCRLSKDLINIIGIKDISCVKLQIGKSVSMDNNYIILYEKNFIYLISENEMAVLTYKLK